MAGLSIPPSVSFFILPPQIMPIRKTSKGWYWGSKGPFDTKAKARQVEKAAYASGYKSKHKKKR